MVLLSKDVDESVEVLASYRCGNQNIVAHGIRKCNAVSKQSNGLIQDPGVAKRFEQNLPTHAKNWSMINITTAPSVGDSPPPRGIDQFQGSNL